MTSVWAVRSFPHANVQGCADLIRVPQSDLRNVVSASSQNTKNEKSRRGSARVL